MPFQCSICAEESTRICARCTKDACNNHLCEKCLRCSDCCECEVTLSEPSAGMAVGSARSVFRAATAVPMPEAEVELEPEVDIEVDPAPQPEPPHPPPDPDPEPVPEDEPGLA
jgi:hypothetical protein